MNNAKNEDVVLCIYDEKGTVIKDRILETFEKHVMSNVQNINS